MRQRILGTLALTLLVVSLQVPKNFGELRVSVRGFVPFAICFGLFSLLWHAHYKFFRRYALARGLRKRQLQQPHGTADFFFSADQVDVVSFVEGVIRSRIGDDTGIAADSDNAGSGAFSDTEIGEGLTMGFGPDFDFEWFESDFRLDRKLFDGSSAKHFVSPLAHREDLAVDRGWTMPEPAENPPDDLQ